MITRELGGDTAFVPKAPGVLRVLGEWREPKRVHPEGPEETILDLLVDAGDISSVKIGLWVHLRIFHRTVVGRIAIQEAVDHHEIHGGPLPVGAVQLGSLPNDISSFQWNEHVISFLFIPRAEYTNMTAPFAKSRFRDRNVVPPARPQNSFGYSINGSPRAPAASGRREWHSD